MIDEEKMPLFIPEQMMEIWQEKLPPTPLTWQIKELFGGAYKYKFESSLQNWSRYCDIVLGMYEKQSSGPYFQYEEFIRWILKFETIDQFVGKPLKDKDGNILVKKDVLCLIDDLKEGDSKSGLRKRIFYSVGYKYYYRFFHEMELEKDADKWILIAPNGAIEDIWETQFNELLKKIRNI